jgi:hypothetical protein
MYEALDERATYKEVESGKVKVFAGSYTEVWVSTGISQTYYKPVRRALERHEAIEVLQRGSRNADTVIVLKGLPDTWDIDGWNDKSGLTATTRYAKLEVEVANLKQSLGGMNVVKALEEIERRLVQLETKNKKSK